MVKLMRTYPLGLAALVALLSALPGAAEDKAPPIEPKADKVLKQMSDYLAGLKQFTLEGEEFFDEILDNGQKLQFSHQRKATVSRPSKVLAEFKGDLADRVFTFNGETAVLFDRDKNVYSVLPFKGTIDGLIDTLHDKYGFSVPLSDLILSDPYKVLTREVTSGSYVGTHNVGGVKCHHLAFTQKLVDWQIWIDAGEKPLPRKLIITQKQVRGEPQYTAVLPRWDTAPKVMDSMFDFTPPKGARKIDFLKPQAGGVDKTPDGKK